MVARPVSPIARTGTGRPMPKASERSPDPRPTDPPDLSDDMESADRANGEGPPEQGDDGDSRFDESDDGEERDGRRRADGPE